MSDGIKAMYEAMDDYEHLCKRLGEKPYELVHPLAGLTWVSDWMYKQDSTYTQMELLKAKYKCNSESEMLKLTPLQVEQLKASWMKSRERAFYKKLRKMALTARIKELDKQIAVLKDRLKDVEALEVA